MKLMSFEELNKIIEKKGFRWSYDHPDVKLHIGHDLLSSGLARTDPVCKLAHLHRKIVMNHFYGNKP